MADWGHLKISVLIVCEALDHDKQRLPDFTNQTLDPSLFEVVYIMDETDEVVRRAYELLERENGNRIQMRMVTASSPRRSVGRNAGLKTARAPLVVLFAADFAPLPGMLADHLAFHEAHRDERMVGIGAGWFPEEYRKDPFMRWLEDSGSLFGVGFTSDPVQMPNSFFYGANASLKKTFLEAAGPSNEKFPYEAWDDYELGLRLSERGMEAHYLPGSGAMHIHTVSMEGRGRALAQAGESAALMEEIRPGPKPWHPQAVADVGRLEKRERILRWKAQFFPGENNRAAYYRAWAERVFVEAYQKGLASLRERQRALPIEPDRCTVSIIIPHWNNLHLLKECLDSLRATVHVPHEVWIIDDGSTDGSREFLRTLPEPFHVIYNETPHGFARNNNEAARRARGTFLCFLNNDTVLRPGWLEPMLETFDIHPGAGLVGNVQWSPRQGRYDHVGVFFDAKGGPHNCWLPSYRRPWRVRREWPAVTAACAVARRAVFLAVGGFDEGFVTGFEDVDLCFRLRALGYRHYVANRSIIVHHVSSTAERFDHEQANARLFLERWKFWSRQEHRRRHAESIFAWMLAMAPDTPEMAVARTYLRKHRLRPWKYNGPKMLRCIGILVSAWWQARQKVPDTGIKSFLRPVR
jgi:GT2 family glycosyltransferase